jgi:phage host-nuclease inhibitor protein Gam
MSDWQRKELQYLLDGIKVRMEDESLPALVRERLAKIHENAGSQAQNIKASLAVLETVKLELCSACRDEELCHCNTLRGWNHECPFLRQE